MFFTHSVKVLWGGVKVTGRRTACREEHKHMVDNLCGIRGARGKPFYLKDNSDYHIDFSHIAFGAGLAIPFTKASDSFRCRAGRLQACQFE